MINSGATDSHLLLQRYQYLACIKSTRYTNDMNVWAPFGGYKINIPP